MLTDIKITTELLYQAALAFALLDTILVSLLVWRIKEETFQASRVGCRGNGTTRAKFTGRGTDFTCSHLRKTLR